METEWMLARFDLYRLIQKHPDWSVAQLAKTVGYSVSWVKKWRKRFRDAPTKSWEILRSQSRAPKHPRRVHPTIRQAVLSLRDTLPTIYHRQAGPRLILYHLNRLPDLPPELPRPRSTHTIWKILKEAGRIPEPTRVHHPLERPEPLSEWEIDFGVRLHDDKVQSEFFVAVDCGTSLLLHTHTRERFHADTALETLAQLLVLRGCPQRIRMDRDSRLVGGWQNDGFPSATLRFLLGLGIQPEICPPRRPDLKPYVERCIRTLKHECLQAERPVTVEQTEEVLTRYQPFYNEERPHQGSGCNNQPPQVAFSTLPVLPAVPEMVDPDRWLMTYHGRAFRRQVSSAGAVMVDKSVYFVGHAYAGKRVSVHVDAQQRQLHIVCQGKPVKSVDIQGLHGRQMTFQEYLALMLEEARSIERHLQFKGQRQAG